MGNNKQEIGTIGWIDLTINNPEEVREFYSAVTGWKPEPFSMGDYDDYVMNTPETNQGVAGVCHAKGGNSDMPPQWLIYINVADIEASINKCLQLGGKVVVNTKEMGNMGRYCVIQDPAGAVCALFEQLEK